MHLLGNITILSVTIYGIVTFHNSINIVKYQLQSKSCVLNVIKPTFFRHSPLTAV